MGGTHSHEVYSIPIEEVSENENLSSIRRNPMIPDELVESMKLKDIVSCWDMFLMGAERNRDGRCLGYRKGNQYAWLSFKDVEEEVVKIGSGLIKLQLCPEQKFTDEPYAGARAMRPVGVFMKNCMEWLILEQAVNAFGFTLIPLYDTLGDEAMAYICKQTQMTTLVTSISQLQTIKSVLPSLDILTTLIIVGTSNDEEIYKHVSAFDLGEKKVLSWNTVRSAGANNPLPPNRDPKMLDRIQTICYTSGTTGVPKGVLYTHGAIISSICSLIRGPFLRHDLIVGVGDVHLSYLPLAHILERLLCFILLNRGSAIGFYSGDVQKLLDDAQCLQPTIFVSVPRLYCKINDKVNVGIGQKSSLSQFLFRFAMNSKLESLRRYGSVSHWLWDKIVFKKTKKLLGNRVRYLVSGGAPLDSHVQERVQLLFCAPLVQGYGLTETLGAAFMSFPFDTLAGHVGGPLPWCEFRLKKVQEMGHDPHGTPPVGELIVRGPAMSKGYFRAHDLTEEAFDSDGWFHTGDICVILPTGAIKIIDRKKNIFKLSQGEYVAPEKIEAVYLKAELVGQIFVFGNSFKNSLVAIVVPDVETVKGHREDPIRDLCNSNEFKGEVERQMREVSSELKGFEKVKAIRLTPESFTLENGLLTPTLKLKRNVAEHHFKKLIDEMYKQLD